MAKRGGCAKVIVLPFLLLILVGLGAWLVSNLNRVANHETTDGVVVELIRGTDSDGDTTYTPVYEYVVGGEVYRYQSGVSFSGVVIPDIGDRRTILYNPGNPADARVHNLFLLIWLPIILMAIPVLIAVGIFWAMRRRRLVADQAPPWSGEVPIQLPDWTTQPPVSSPPAGTVIEATFMGTEPSQMDERGKVRYRVKARVEIDGEIHRFRSEWMDDDPTLHYMQLGNKVGVKIDPNDPSVYEVLLPEGD